MMSATWLPNRLLPPISKVVAPDEQLLLGDKSSFLKNGIPIHIIEQKGPGIVRMDIVVPAGVRFQEFPLTAQFSARLLKEGTSKHTSEEIAGTLDFYGAYLEVNAERDRAVISLYAPKRFIDNLLPLVREIWDEANYPEELVEIEIRHQKQEYLINDMRVSWVARHAFNKQIFGDQHPYGSSPDLSDFDHLQKEMLATHFSKYYHQSPYFILSGDIDDGVLKSMEQSFGDKLTRHSEFRPPVLPAPNAVKARRVEIHRPHSVQSAIRTGRLLFSRDHEDFMGMQLVVTLLGGYFGSRLMKNLREDKGFTYGVGAFIQPMEESGSLVISTEVGSDVSSQAISEIMIEIARMTQEEVGQEELARVKNYLLGSMQRALDGALARAERLRGLIDIGESDDYFVRLKYKFLSMSPKDVMELSSKYLDPNDMTTVIVGKTG